MTTSFQKLSPFTMFFFILAVQILGLLLAAPFNANNIKAFSDPESVLNPLYYIVLILAFTLVLLVIIRLGKRWIIQLIMGTVLVFTLYYVYASALSVVTDNAWLFGIALTATTAFIIFYYPEWYVIDFVGVLVGAGAAAIFGISLAIVPILLLLVLLAIYDFISVYQTKHMISLAEGVVDLKIPVLFVVPRSRGYSHVKWVQDTSAASNEERLERREAYFMGLGDAVIPTTLVISANVFLNAPAIGFVNIPALGALVGTLIAYVALMTLVIKGKPQAGLPFLNTGAILGFFIGAVTVGVRPF